MQHQRTSIKNLRKRQQARAAAAAAASDEHEQNTYHQHRYQHQTNSGDRYQNSSRVGSGVSDHQNVNIQPPTIKNSSNNSSYSAMGDSTTENNTERLEIVKMISDHLGTGLTEGALQAIIDLLQQGVHPDAIVSVVTSLSQTTTTTTSSVQVSQASVGRRY
jgi:Mitotic-spindle organizing gamma-tubulin ring associated